jgi:hypothetical protein
MTTSSDDSDLERVPLDEHNRIVRIMAEAHVSATAEMREQLAETERLRELLREARGDVAEIAGQQTKQHRIEAYRDQLAEIDAALGAPK